MKKVSVILFLIISTVLHAENLENGSPRMVQGLNLNIEASATVGSDTRTPMWLMSNRYGLVSPNSNSAYERLTLYRSIDNDSARQWRWGYNLDLTLNQNAQAKFMVHQAYAELAWKKGLLTIGQKEIPMELKYQTLSSGGQALGINSMPVPQIRIALEDYYLFKFTRNWLGFKGHLAYGMNTDANWQKEFTRKESKYIENQLYHTKAGFLKLQKPGSPFKVEVGLEMAVQFGGTSHMFDNDGTSYEVKHASGFSGFLHAFIPGGSDSGEEAYANGNGNTLGSWLARFTYDFSDHSVSIYADKFFEDHSAMFLIDYDGYVAGENWNKLSKNKWIMYSPKDIMVGAEWKYRKPWYVDNIVFEYIYTKYQSGPVYHDRTPQLSDHVAGRDNYYNHYFFTGWQHWGQVSGNPLYLSPIYNEDGKVETKANRFSAVHTGIGGTIIPSMKYRVLASWQSALGTYYNLYPTPKDNVSLLAEIVYSDFSMSKSKGWYVKAAFGLDNGRLRGNNVAGQLTIAKNFKLYR